MRKNNEHQFYQLSSFHALSFSQLTSVQLLRKFNKRPCNCLANMLCACWWLYCLLSAKYCARGRAPICELQKDWKWVVTCTYLPPVSQRLSTWVAAQVANIGCIANIWRVGHAWNVVLLSISQIKLAGILQVWYKWCNQLKSFLWDLWEEFAILVLNNTTKDRLVKEAEHVIELNAN